ncbi:hypothetical protein [Variovorax atrisoli]|uniref:deoxynucleotide monophosphate kinase family protein n=1 Tax=Variovorax atrisoli TaxID=3394203 RepID=UPI00036C9899|nr:hypothetical protein [Variovorax paradoxus]
MKKHLFGLTGYAGAGKDTVADLLVTQGFRKMAFADALRGELANAFEVGIDVFTNPIAKERPQQALSLSRAPAEFRAFLVMAQPREAIDANGAVREDWLHEPRSPRQLMQWWGTEYRRKQDTLYWVKQLNNKLTFYRHTGERRFVITDCRFDNEVDLVRALGGTIWQITRPGHDGASENGHVSATSGARFKPDAVIANAYDVRHLHGLVLSEFVARDLGVDRANVSVQVAA